MDKFIHKFVSSHPMIKISAYLMNIHQVSSESLRSYIQNFYDESVQIFNLDKQVTIATFTNGLVVEPSTLRC